MPAICAANVAALEHARDFIRKWPIRNEPGQLRDSADRKFCSFSRERRAKLGLEKVGSNNLVKFRDTTLGRGCSFFAERNCDQARSVNVGDCH